ncbi:MAG: hypothetical protein H9W81_15540 [Enterococcus sp.]|nr:hypothetical protein [Enterococcus sp.]
MGPGLGYQQLVWYLFRVYNGGLLRQQQPQPSTTSTRINNPFETNLKPPSTNTNHHHLDPRLEEYPADTIDSLAKGGLSRTSNDN